MGSCISPHGVFRVRGERGSQAVSLGNSLGFDALEGTGDDVETIQDFVGETRGRHQLYRICCNHSCKASTAFGVRN